MSKINEQNEGGRIQILIDLPEEVYTAITTMGLWRVDDRHKKTISKAFSSGTVISCPHDKLNDASYLEEKCAMHEAPAILEADKEAQEVAE